MLSLPGHPCCCLCFTILVLTPCSSYHTCYRTHLDQQLGPVFWTFTQHYYLLLICVPLTYLAFQAPYTYFRIAQLLTLAIAGSHSPGITNQPPVVPPTVCDSKNTCKSLVSHFLCGFPLSSFVVDRDNHFCFPCVSTNHGRDRRGRDTELLQVFLLSQTVGGTTGGWFVIPGECDPAIARVKSCAIRK